MYESGKYAAAIKCMEPELTTTVAILRWLYQSNSIEKLRQKCGEYRKTEKKVVIIIFLHPGVSRLALRIVTNTSQMQPTDL